MESYDHWLREPARGLFPDAVLAQPVSQLQGVTAQAEQALAAVGIHSILDLGASALFGLARAIGDAAAGIERLGAPGALPADMIDDSARGASASAVAAMPLQVLRALGPGLARRLADALPAASVRDLGCWPPAVSASRLVRIAHGGIDDVVDPQAPAELQPRMGRLPVDRVQYEVLLFEGVIGAGGCEIVMPETETEPDGRDFNPMFGPDPVNPDGIGAIACGPLLEGLEFPIDLTDQLLGKGFQQPGFGFVLTMAQSWYSLGLSLGQLLHSLALAPGEATRLAVVDWSRKLTTATVETIAEDEALQAGIERNRSVSEVIKAVNSEAQRGFSSFNTTAAGWGVGAGVGAGASGKVPVGGVPVDVSGSAAVGFGYSRNDAQGSAFASSQGRREVASDMTQRAQDRTQQYASLSRGRRASIVSEVSVSEAERLSTRVVANYNHMHALSVLYFEVVQLYRVVTECVASEPVVYIPVRPLDFGREDLLERYRDVLAAVALSPAARDALLGVLAPVAPAPGAGSVPGGDVEISFYNPSFRPDVVDERGQLLRDGPLRLALGPNAATEANLLRFSRQHARLAEIQLGSVDSSRRCVANAVVLAGSNRLAVPMRQWANPPKDPTRYLPERGESLTAYRAELPAGWSDGQINVSIETQADWRWDQAVDLRNLAIGASARLRFELIDPATGKDRGSFVELQVGLPNTRPDNSMQLASLTAVAAAAPPTAAPLPPPYDLAAHLRAHAMHYTMAVLRRADPSLLGYALSGLKAGGRPLLGQVDPVPIATSGNYLVFRWPALSGSAMWTQLRRLRGLVDSSGAHVVGRRESLVPVPSGGVFAEAVLGRFNSAEKLDMTRFWNWQDSPTPLVPPEIAPLQAGIRTGAAALTPGQLGAANLQQKDAPPLPDPSGAFVKALELAGKGDAFRDMGALDKLLAAGSTATTLAAQGAQQFMKTAMDTVSAYGARVNQGKEMDERAKKEAQAEAAAEKAKAATAPAGPAPNGTPTGGGTPPAAPPGGGAAPATSKAGGTAKAAPSNESAAFHGPAGTNPAAPVVNPPASPIMQGFTAELRREVPAGGPFNKGTLMNLDGQLRLAGLPTFRQGLVPPDAELGELWMTLRSGVGSSSSRLEADAPTDITVVPELRVGRLFGVGTRVSGDPLPALPEGWLDDLLNELCLQANTVPVAGRVFSRDGASLRLNLNCTVYDRLGIERQAQLLGLPAGITDPEQRSLALAPMVTGSTLTSAQLQTLRGFIVTQLALSDCQSRIMDMLSGMGGGFSMDVSVLVGIHANHTQATQTLQVTLPWMVISSCRVDG